MPLNNTFKHYLDAQSKEFNLLTSVSYLGVGLLVTLFLSSRYLTPKGGNGAIRQLGGFPILTAWEFFTKRHDFIWANFRNDLHFKFKVLQHNVVVLRGEESRKAFFDSRNLSFTEGYKVLSGDSPQLEDIDIEEVQRHAASSFSKNKYIVKLLNRDRLSDVLPSLFSDLDKRIGTWGKHGRMDPFKTIYELVFQMTIRMTTCTELSDNPKAVEEILALYRTLEASATPTALLLPWFPGSAKKKKKQANTDLFMKLLEEGLGNVEILRFILGVLFAGVINTGIIPCWSLIYLAFHTDWKAKAKAEVDGLIHKHTTNTSNEPLHKQLAAIHISAWEDEMPVLDLIIRETLRLSMVGVLLRRNILEDTTFSGGLVERGDFIAYPMADVHLNPDIYSRPHEFDPARFTEGREEDKKGTYSYLSWGAGYHPCTGVKVAKLEMKIIIAFVLTAFEFSMVDKFGEPLTELPKVNRNDIYQARPLNPCYIKFDRTVE